VPGCDCDFGAGLSAPVVVFGGRSRTHDEIDARAARAATGIRAFGVGDGDCVVLLLRNGLLFFEASKAVMLAGAYPVPVNINKPEDVPYIIENCRAQLVIAEVDFAAFVPADLRIVLAEDWDDWIAGLVPILEQAAVPRAAIIYTSGTTGRPKGIKRAPVKGENGSARALQVYGLDMAPPLQVLINGPLFHSVPNAYSRLALRVGADIVLEEKFEPEALLAQIARHRVTHMHITPAMLVRLLGLRADIRAAYDLSSLRYVVHGAAPCAPSVKTAMISWWGPILHEYYGSTETGLLTWTDSQTALRKPGSVGRALAGITLKVFDDQGVEVGPGGLGQIYAGSESLHEFTYIDAEAKRAEIGRGQLVTAGDFGWLDGEGFLYLAGRAKDAMAVAGARVFPIEIESAILAVPGVKDCAVFGVKAANGEEAVIACVSLFADARVTGEEIMLFLSARLPARKIPARIEILAELPREDSGKIFKNLLRERYVVGGR
jgi:long-chain acyl-CoA synthetase